MEYGVDNLPHPSSPIKAANKRTALYENLMSFSPSQQYRIIKELSALPQLSENPTTRLKDLKIRLVTRYSSLDKTESPSEANETLIEETKHWLADYPSSLSLFTQALEKYNHGSFKRNLLDDLRLALEQLLKHILKNSKSLENQIAGIGVHIKTCGGSPELANMFVKLIDYYSKYHNTYVKHDDGVIEEEIEFVLEISSSFMKHIVRLSAKD